MKKIFILITTIILAFSMVSCNIQEFVSGWETTSTTSGETTTTYADEYNHILLRDMINWEDVALIKIYRFDITGFTPALRLYPNLLTEKSDIEEFLGVFVYGNIAIYTDKPEVGSSYSDKRYDYVKEMRVRDEFVNMENIGFDIYVYNQDGKDLIYLELLPIDIVKIHNYSGTYKGNYHSIVEGGIDWKIMMEMYEFTYEEK